jgi:hypothetical protein
MLTDDYDSKINWQKSVNDDQSFNILYSTFLDHLFYLKNHRIQFVI